MICLIWITSGCRWKATISFNLCICKSCEVMNFKDAECNAGKWYQVTHTFFKVSSLLKEIDLADQRDTLSKDLSGGQKRKLSVGIALIGDPKVHTCMYLLTCKCFEKMETQCHFYNPTPVDLSRRQISKFQFSLMSALYSWSCILVLCF